MKALEDATRETNRKVKEIKGIEEKIIARQRTKKMLQGAAVIGPLPQIGYLLRKQNLFANRHLTSQPREKSESCVMIA